MALFQYEKCLFGFLCVSPCGNQITRNIVLFTEAPVNVDTGK